MLFVVIGRFRADAAAKRSGLREAFSDHLASHAPRIRLGGPLKDADGGDAAVFFVLEARDRKAVDDFLSASPYKRADLYQDIEVNELTVEVGRLS